MTPRVLLEHDRPRADGSEPRHVDRLVATRRGYVVEWDAERDAPTAAAGTSVRLELPDALAAWYTMPRDGERRVGRAPRGFEAARRKAREG